MNNAGKNMYEKLTIRNKFMFGKVTQNPVIAQKMADLLTPVEIGAVTEVEREKFLHHRSSSKYVKLDMYLEDENGRVVDTEMQNKSNNKMVQEELPLRIRYYQGMIDQEILSSGTDYIFLKETYIIFICTYDPFGKGKYVYHFHMACDEDESIQLHDKMNWIFYNTTADLSEVPEGIKKFLNYVENEHAEDEFAKTQRSANKLKAFCNMINGFRENLEDGMSVNDLLQEILEQTEYFAYLEEDDPTKADDRKANVQELSSMFVKYQEEDENFTLQTFLEDADANYVCLNAEDEYKSTKKQYL